MNQVYYSLVFKMCLLCLSSMFDNIYSQTTTLITFDEPPLSNPPSPVSVRYSNQGILLPEYSTIVSVDEIDNNLGNKSKTKVQSGTNVLCTECTKVEFMPRPLIVEFTFNIESFSFYTGYPKNTNHQHVRIKVEVYDENNNKIDLVEKDLGPGPVDIKTPIQIGPIRNKLIRKIEIVAKEDVTIKEENEGTTVDTYVYIDNLAIISEGAPPVISTERPTIDLRTTPSDLSETTDGNVLIGGEIYDCPFPQYAAPVVKTSWLPNPTETKQNIEVITLSLGKNLFGSPPSSPLSFIEYFRLVNIGENNITVSASNAIGTTTVGIKLYYYPQEMLDEVKKQGGIGKYGLFKWGSTSTGDCKIAVFEHGAIFVTKFGVYSAFGEIYSKWCENPILGCAIAQEKEEKCYWGVAISCQSQDFENGRIYTSKRGTFCVSEPFRSAIDKLDFINKYGFPASNTETRSEPRKPRRWQKFESTYLNQNLISTMEVTESKGVAAGEYNTPYTLWIATPDYNGIKKAGATVTTRIPYIWLSFPYEKLGSKCYNINEPIPAKRLEYGELEATCNFDHYPSCVAMNTPNWASIMPLRYDQIKDTIITCIGTVKTSALSGDDWIGNHDCCCGACGVGSGVGADWYIKVIPEPFYEGLITDKTNSLEIEYEYCKTGYPYPPNKVLKPGEKKYTIVPGDRLFIAGRWVADCGCHGFWKPCFCDCCYQAEMHPPAAMVNMYTEFGDAGQYYTRADLLYFDWWFPNQKATLEIFPPPRPDPDSVLTYYSPYGWDICPKNCGYLLEDWPAINQNHIRITLTGRPDVPFNTPPRINSDHGQLYQGFNRYWCGGDEVWKFFWPKDYEHMAPLLGEFMVYWTKN